MLGASAILVVKGLACAFCLSVVRRIKFVWHILTAQSIEVVGRKRCVR